MQKKNIDVILRITAKGKDKEEAEKLIAPMEKKRLERDLEITSMVKGK